MPRRLEDPRVSLLTEVVVDVLTTALLFAILYYGLDMPWGLALLVALGVSVLGWYCLFHLERDSSGDWGIGSGGSFWDGS